MLRLFLRGGERETVAPRKTQTARGWREAGRWREREISIRIIFTFLPSNQHKFKPRLVQIKRGRDLGLGKRRRDTLRKKLIQLRNISLPDEMTPR